MKYVWEKIIVEIIRPSAPDDAIINHDSPCYNRQPMEDTWYSSLPPNESQAILAENRPCLETDADRATDLPYKIRLTFDRYSNVSHT